MEWDNSLVTVDCCDVDRTRTSSIKGAFSVCCVRVPSLSETRLLFPKRTGNNRKTFLNVLIAEVNYSQTEKETLQKIKL